VARITLTEAVASAHAARSFDRSQEEFAMLVRKALLALAVLTATASVSAAQTDGFGLTDLTGRTIELAGPAERIVAIPIPAASIVAALDGGVDRIAALHPEAKGAVEQGILGEFFPSLRDLPSNILADGATRGRKPDLEALAALDPDLVIQWEHAGPDAASLIDAGLPTALIRFGEEEYIRSAIALLGDAIGKPDKVEMLMEWRDQVSAEIASGLAEVPESERPKVAYFFYGLTDLHTEGTGTYADWQLGHVGGINAAAGIDGWGPVATEVVAEWNPDIILLGTFEPGLHIDRILDDPVLSQTSAARNKRVYKMPLGGYRWESASHESPFTWMWLANILHPDRFQFDLRGVVVEWYPRLYGQSPAEEQLDAMLQMDMNASSANYAVFAAP
jgi:iron complex transport system substrate-binding protein